MPIKSHNSLDGGARGPGRRGEKGAGGAGMGVKPVFFLNKELTNILII